MSENSIINGDNEKVKENRRIWEIDFVRGVAILIMVVIHFIFVTSTFFGIDVFEGESLLSTISSLLQQYGGIVFIIISGISAILSSNNSKRGLQLFFVAMLVTYVTLIFSSVIMNNQHNYTVRFGILHFLSICMILSPFFMKVKSRYLIPIALIAIFVGIYCRNNGIDIAAIAGYEIHPWFRSSDYFPLLPYIGYFIIGIVIGRIVYKEKKSIFKNSDKIEKNVIIRFFSFCGRHTLIIYLVHQPILFGILEILSRSGVI